MSAVPGVCAAAPAGGARRRCAWPGLLLLALAPPVPAQVVLEETRSDYPLRGRTAEVLRDQLQRRLTERAAEGGVISHGLTRAALETRYALQPDEAGGCLLAAIQVQLSIDTLLPSWQPVGRPAAGLRPRVEAMLAGLARHEAGHRDHVIESANRIDARLRALAPAADCATLRRAAQRLVSRALIRLRVDEWNYDLATQGGRRQGAVLAAE